MPLLRFRSLRRLPVTPRYPKSPTLGHIPLRRLRQIRSPILYALPCFELRQPSSLRFFAGGHFRSPRSDQRRLPPRVMHRRFLNKADVPLPVSRRLVTWPGCFGSRQHPWDFTLRSLTPIGESPASLPVVPHVPFSPSSPRSFSSRDQPPPNSLQLHPLR
jgi:hypothetical protein